MKATHDMVKPEMNGIYEDFSGKIRTYLAGKVRSPQDLDDLTQEIFIKIHTSHGTLKDERKLAPWIYSIVRNSITDYYRKMDKGSKSLDENLSYSDDSNEEKNINGILYCLKVFIDRLPEKYREPVILSDIEGVKQKDLAKRMGLSYTGLKSRVQRGREMIKGMFIECCGVPFGKEGKLTGDCLDHENCKICNPPAS
jgi:RNA polymerase sigma-70 factor, ECF subfamily